ncbi:helix-turn-helix transcriptional regulator [Abyssibius alkaniclasticus]|uniref:helix-turn-helix transcriptional regulator n=1 Tax=Abyssibius alkaniclasticus TaxID=2881234 RepID=UPI004058E328
MIKKRPIKFSKIIRGVLIFQVVCTSLFLFKVIADLFAIPLFFVPWSALESVEILSTFGMLIGVFTSFWLISLMEKRSTQVEERVRAASGDFHNYIQVQFNAWNLTPTEKTVATLVIKGFSNNEIADLRGTSESTIKSQLTSIFKKSNMSTRQQLVSWVVEDLVEKLPTEHQPELDTPNGAQPA